MNCLILIYFLFFIFLYVTENIFLFAETELKDFEE